jgi:cell division protein FtsQ
LRFFKKKSEDSRSRRSTRLQILRLREFALLAILLSAAGALGFAGYHNDAFKKFNASVTVKTLAYTANAGFKVKDILVTGRTQISSDELLSRLSIKENMPIFGVDIAAAQKSLTDITWVKSVSISRRLPDKIVIDLQERKPVALWQYRKKLSVIDQEGVVLTSEGLNAWQQLPLVVGEDAPKHVMELLGLLNAEPAVASQLISATRVGGRRWDLHLKNGISVKLPEQDSELALRTLAAEEEQKNILGRNIVSIDLRQPEKMVVTPVAGAQDTSEKKHTKTSI